MAPHFDVPEIEVKPAIRNVASRTAVRSNGLAVELYEGLPGMPEEITVSVSAVLQIGEMPRKLGQVRVVPVGKLGRGLRRADSRRPITLLCAAGRVVESVPPPTGSFPPLSRDYIRLRLRTVGGEAKRRA